MYKKNLIFTLLSAFCTAFLCAFYFWCLAYMGLNPFGKLKYMYWGIYGICFALFFYLVKYGFKKTYSYGWMLLNALLFNLFASCFLFFIVWAYLTFLDPNKLILQQYIKEALVMLGNMKSSLLENNIVEEKNFSITKRNLMNLTHFEISLDQGIGMGLIGIVLSFFFTIMYRYSGK